MCVYCYLSFQSQIWQLPSLTFIIRLPKWTTLTANLRNLCFRMCVCVKGSEKCNNEVIDIYSNKTVTLWLLALNELFHTAKCEIGASLRKITESSVYLQSEWIFIFRFIYPFNLSSQYGTCTSIILLNPGSYNPHLSFLQDFHVHLMTTSRNLFQSAGLKRERHIARPLISFIMLFFMSRLSTQRLSESVTSSISSRHFSTRL